MSPRWTGSGERPRLRERLTVQENHPDPIAVSSLTRAGGTATVTTAVPHPFTTGDFIEIAGASPTGYNGTWKITVTGPSTFTYLCNSTLATPATGSAITALYVSDAQGGQAIGWDTYRVVFAEMQPLSAAERLQAAALQSSITYRFRVQTIDAAGVTAVMRALWTPQWPITGRQEHTLEIHGVVPDGDGHQYTFLECGEVA
jgi:head-tail adaptor